MKQQQGAALVIVMALLAGALMLGMSGMQSGLIDERLAGNYRASVQAQMNAEEIAAILTEDVSVFYNATDAIDCEAFEASYPENRKNTGFAQLIGSEEKGQYVPCEGAVNEMLFLVEGIVGNTSEPFAKHILKAGRVTPEGGTISLPDDLAGYTVMAAGAVSGVTPSSDINGRYADNLGITEVPDPRSKHPSDESRTGFISRVREKAFNRDADIIEACDSQGVQNAKSNQTKYVYCSSGFNGSIDSVLNGLTVVSESSMSNLSVRDDVKVNLVSGGSMSMKGFGNNVITGIFWTAGSISLQGRSNVIGGVYANGAIDFSGKTALEGSDEPFDDAGGSSRAHYVWDS